VFELMAAPRHLFGRHPQSDHTRAKGTLTKAFSANWNVRDISCNFQAKTVLGQRQRDREGDGTVITGKMLAGLTMAEADTFITPYKKIVVYAAEQAKVLESNDGEKPISACEAGVGCERV
jgi:hypothetical protein